MGGKKKEMRRGRRGRKKTEYIRQINSKGSIINKKDGMPYFVFKRRRRFLLREEETSGRWEKGGGGAYPVNRKEGRGKEEKVTRSLK